MKKIAFVLVPLLMMSACSAKLDAKDNDKQLVVMSYNIRSDIDGKLSDGEDSWCYRQDASYALFKEFAPDVCGMQEVRPHQRYDMEMNCPGYVFIGVGRDDGLNKGEHMLIAFRKKAVKLLDWGTYWLSETPDVPSKGWDAAYPRTATWAKFKHIASGREFFFVNTHLDNKGAEAKRNGLALIVNKIADMNPDNIPMILTGDFNMTPADEKMDDLKKVMTSARDGAEDSDTAYSFNDFGRSDHLWILDYIYYNGFTACKSFKVINKQFGKIPYISDHYPIQAVFEW